MRWARLVLLIAVAGCCARTAAADNGLAWRAWDSELFNEAKSRNRFVILDLEAVWCHWCHVMEQTTYRDEKVVALLKSKYITVRVDQDANPDLSNRYGDWGWPATIIFSPDGTEIAKRRGYLPPEAMASLLAAVIADPTPGPSVGHDTDLTPAASFLTKTQRETLIKRTAQSYDEENGGWGDVHKFIDPDSMDWLLSQAENSDEQAAAKAKKTFNAAFNLIDPVWGGIYQYSDAADWKSPHYEKIMWYQAQAMRQYAAAYALWKEPEYLAAAKDVYRYLTSVLQSPEGAFFTSQDADADEKTPGKVFYALDDAARRNLGRQPRVDTNIYARENGWAISGLVAYYAVSGEPAVIEATERAAHFILANRKLDGGGFRHGENDRGGPYLGDTLAMGQAALDLYAATGKQEWLQVAGNAGKYIAANFTDTAGGFVTTLKAEGTTGVFLKPSKPLDEQIQVTRFANRLHRYFGSESFRAMAEHGMRLLTSDTLLSSSRLLPGILVADQELSADPTHVTIVGHKDDPAAMSLHAAARALPAIYKRLDWWDKREGALPNPDVTYPELDRAAAFACSNKICSLPVFSPAELAGTILQISKLKVTPPRT